MMRKISFFVVVAMLFAQTLLAAEGGGGSVAGNGGDALVCDSGEVSFFDLFEARNVRGLKIDFGPEGLEPSEKVEYALERLPDVLSALRSLVEDRLELFQKRSVIGDFDLVDIPDSDNIFVKPGCHIEQAVVQRQPLAPDEPIFYISKRLWDRMDNDSRAALILHEIIYYDAIINGHTSSRITRALNAYMMAEQTPIDRACLISRTMLASGLGAVVQEFRFDGLVVDALRATVTDDCRVTKGFVSRGNLKIGDQIVKPIVIGESRFASEWGVTEVSLREPYVVQYVHFSEPIHLLLNDYEAELSPVRTMEWKNSKFWNLVSASPQAFKERPGFIYRNREGKILSASVERTVVRLFGQSVHVRGEMNFFSNGDKIESIFFAPVGSLTIDGQRLEVTKIECSGPPFDGLVYRISVAEGKVYYVTSATGHRLRVDSKNPLTLEPSGRVIGGSIDRE